MLTQYQTDLNNLLQNPGATAALYPTVAINRFINIARGQVAGEAECIRVTGTVSTVIGQRNYNFSAINIGVPAATGIQAVIHVRRINVAVGAGENWVSPYAWEWFNFYYLNNTVPNNGRPSVWSQRGQGAASSFIGTNDVATGDFWVDPIPDAIYQLNCDCVCYPQTLALDTDVEALPYLWTDAVPFFAAYYAFLSSQTAARQADAERMFKHYQTFMQRARTASNPSVLRPHYEQVGDPVQANKIGIKTGANQ